MVINICLWETEAAASSNTEQRCFIKYKNVQIVKQIVYEQPYKYATTHENALCDGSS